MRKKWVIAVSASLCALGVLIVIAPPNNFASVAVVIPNGASASIVARRLVETHVIAHAMPLSLILRVTGGDSRVRAGTYRFATPPNIISVITRLVTGDFGIPLVRITFPEGITTFEAAALVESTFPAISALDFEKVAMEYEGYLFPDTYFFSASTTAEDIVSSMRANFDSMIAPLADDISASGHSHSDIIIVASLLEKEARTTESRRIISGILWNRLKIDMLLQVDAVFGYIKERDTYSPSFTDLRIDSPYNTYKHKGLPPGPISNPGKEAIEAAINPAMTEYFYYLTGRDGLMYYSKTYEEHKANQTRYLK